MPKCIYRTHTALGIRMGRHPADTGVFLAACSQKFSTRSPNSYIYMQRDGQVSACAAPRLPRGDYSPSRHEANAQSVLLPLFLLRGCSHSRLVVRVQRRCSGELHSPPTCDERRAPTGLCKTEGTLLHVGGRLPSYSVTTAVRVVRVMNCPSL